MPVQLGPPIRPPTYRVFLSSGDDASVLRNRVDALVTEAINSQLREAGVNLRLEVDRWERTAAASNNPHESTNDQFVRRALESNLTLALLISKMGEGTREEIEATLDAEQTVSVLWFVPRDSNPNSQVADFLKPNRGRLYYDKTGRPEDDASWHGIVRVLFQVVLAGLNDTEEGLYVEQR